MEKENNKIQETDIYVTEYKKIVLRDDNSVIINNEWSKKGDYFVKLTIYNNNYVPIRTLGNTTLISNH